MSVPSVTHTLNFVTVAFEMFCLLPVLLEQEIKPESVLFPLLGKLIFLNAWWPVLGEGQGHRWAGAIIHSGVTQIHHGEPTASCHLELVAQPARIQHSPWGLKGNFL